jgi:hypothetical protein
MIGHLGRLLEDEHPNHPQALLERTRTPGRSMGSLARGLETFFTEHGLALANDHAKRLAAGRRRRRIDAVADPLRPAVEAFNEILSKPGRLRPPPSRHVKGATFLRPPTTDL